MLELDLDADAVLHRDAADDTPVDVAPLVELDVDGTREPDAGAVLHPAGEADELRHAPRGGPLEHLAGGTEGLDPTGSPLR